MGADVSSERGYTSNQAAEFERKYREMYGEALSRDELIERYRMEKLKADQKQRMEQAHADSAASRHRNADERHSHRDRPRSRDREGSNYGSNRRQQDNFDIVKRTYDRSIRDEHRDKYRDRHEHRSERRRDDEAHGNGSSRRRHSSRDRDKRRSSSRSSSKESHGQRQSSRKMRSSDRRSGSDNRDRSSRRSDSADQRERVPKSSRIGQEEYKNHSPSSKHRSSKKAKDETMPKDSRIKIKRGSNKSSEKSREKSEDTSSKRNKKKGKSAKSAHYQSAPDLNDSDRQYGRGAWQRTHKYFDEYSHRPQSWVQELARQGNTAMPAPVMERQIIYSVPNVASSNIVDGLGYPLKQRDPGFQPVPYNTYLMHRPSRPVSLDMSMQQSQMLPSISSPLQSPSTRVKLPPGGVPALGPAGAGFTSLPVASQPIIPERGYEVQAHLPPSNPSTLSSKGPNRGSLIPPTYQTPPQYASSTLSRSDAPTPKPRTKSPTKEQKSITEKHVNGPASPRRSGNGKHSKITAISAREDFESMLAPEYDLSGNDILSPYPGNYRPNQEIFVDDVIFRKQPEIANYAASLTDSDATTDDEHFLTLGEELSPNSIGYSSGYDLEIPAGFCFDSEGREIKATAKRKEKELAKSKDVSKTVEETRMKKTNAAHFQFHPLSDKRKQNLSKLQPLVLTSIEPVSRSEARKHRSPDSKESPRRKNFAIQTRSRIEELKQKSEKVKKGEKVQHKKRRNKRIQHPPKNDKYVRIITPSQKWTSKPEPKKTHDVGVGTKPVRHQNSIAVQTPQFKQPTAQPIYFLKPISSHEVFIDDSMASETDASQAQASTATSSGSNLARSSVSWSRSSARSSEADWVEESEVESAVRNPDRIPAFHSGNKDHDRPPASTLPSIESEHPASVGLPSMTLGVSESIQASSYTGKGGKVFCLTRSRQGSPPPSSSRVPIQGTRSMDDHTQLQLRQDGRIDPENDRFYAHEVGKWVLDCYAQDNKLTSRPEGQTDLNPPSPRSDDESNYKDTHPTNLAFLTKQKAIEYEASFDVDSDDFQSLKSPGMPRVLPLTAETLCKHKGSTGLSQLSNQVEDSDTELSAEVGIFQKELIRSRRKIQKQRSNSPEGKLKAQQYKAQLKQWNDSPTSNVVLAEVCCVTDEDVDDHPRLVNTTREIQPSNHISSFSNQNEEEDSDSELIPSESSDEIISPKESLKRALKVGRYAPPEAENRKDLRPKAPAAPLQKSNSLQNGLNFNEKNAPWNPTSRQGIRVPVQLHPDEDWRIVGAPKNYHTSYHPAKDANGNFFQKNPIVPRPQMQRKSAEVNPNSSRIQKADQNPPLKPSSQKKPLGTDAVSSSSSIANPFNKMDEDEINSLVGQISGRGSLEKSASERELLEKLERTRLASKRESLEERTARILGIYRKASTDEEESDDSSTAQKPKVQNPQPPPPPKSFPEPPQRDLNAYVNNLLTGVTDVSPGTRQKHFVGDMGKNQLVTSPLATSSISIKSSHPPLIEMGQVDEHSEKVHEHIHEQVVLKGYDEDSSQADDEDTRMNETFSVNVSETTITASMDYQVKTDVGKQRGPPTPPTEYKIPGSVEGQGRETPMSPTGGMMQSYGNNIYADTPGFHGQQRSFDSTESDEPELEPASKKEGEKPNFPMSSRVQDSPVPISAMSPPLTQQELGIVRELVQTGNRSRTASQSSVAAMDEERMKSSKLPPQDPNRLSPVSTGSSRSSRSRSPTRERAKQKIAKSIGFTLHTEKRQAPQKQQQINPMPFDSAEYEIKVLSAEGKRKHSRNSVPNKDVSQLAGNGGSVENVMESIGLDPNETWLLSV